jgi:hypothetical protein
MGIDIMLGMKPFTLIAAAIFSVMALLHAYRLLVPFPVTVGRLAIGQEVSWAALAVTAVMAIGLLKEARR